MKNLWRFMRLYRPYAPVVLAGAVLSLLTLFAGVALLAVSGWFIAAMGIAGAAAVSMNYFSPAAIIRGLSILRTAGRYGERVANHDAALRVTADFRARFFAALVPLAPAALSDLRHADIFNRLRADIETLERFYLNGVLPLLTAAGGFLILMVFLALINPALAAVQGGLLLIAGVVLPLAARRAVRGDAAAITAAGKARRIALGEMIQAAEEFLVFNRDREKTAHIHAYDTAVKTAQSRIQSREGMIQAAYLFLTGMAVMAAAFFAVPMLRDGAMGGADVAMLFLLALAAFEIVMPLPAAWQAFHAARLAAESVFEIVDRAAPQITADDVMSAAESEEAARAPFALAMDDVAFSYDDDALVLDGFSLSLRAGEIAVITGRSGAGKTSVMNILAGFWPLARGSVTLNGIDARRWAGAVRRGLFGFAPQKPYVFADTVRWNLTLGRGDITDDEIAQACRLAGFAPVLADMAGGLDEYVGEHGARLSGGQIRRLGLARALLSRAPCLVLDEPVEGLDPATAQEVMDNILRAAKMRGQAILLMVHEADKAWIPQDAQIIAL